MPKKDNDECEIANNDNDSAFIGVKGGKRYST